MQCPKCGAPMEDGLPCPSCGYIEKNEASRPDTERGLLAKGYVFDEGLGMYYLLEPGDENLKPSVTWYDPVSDKFETIYDDPGQESVSVTDSAGDIPEQPARPDLADTLDRLDGDMKIAGPDSGGALPVDDRITDFEVDLSAFGDIPDPPPAQGQRAAAGLFGLFAGKEGKQPKKVPQTVDVPGTSGSKRIRQTNMVAKPSRLPAWLTPERLRILIAAGAGVAVILLIILVFILGRNSARPDPNDPPTDGILETDTEDILEYETPSPEPTPDTESETPGPDTDDPPTEDDPIEITAPPDPATPPPATPPVVHPTEPDDNIHRPTPTPEPTPEPPPEP